MSDPTPDVGGWSLPFEEQPMADLHDAADGVVVGALTVAGAVADTAIGRFPALVFRFQDSRGEWSRPVTLLLDAPHLADVPRLVTAATEAAIRRAGGR
jgi:hypothetical protein